MSAQILLADPNGVRIPQLSSAPGTPVVGQMYYNTSTGRLMVYIVSSWVELGASGGGDFLADGTVAMTGNFRLGNNWLSNDGDAEGIRVTTDGKLGVGTSTPNHLFEAVGNVATQSSVVFRQSNSASSLIDGISLDPYFWDNTAGSEGTGIGVRTRDGDGNWDYLLDMSDRLYVYNPAEFRGDWSFFYRRGDNAYGHWIEGFKSRGTSSTPAPVQAEDDLLNLSGYGWNGTDWGLGAGAVISFTATESYTATNQGSKIEFFTTPNASNTSQKRMVIDHSGNVGIGTASPTQLFENAGGRTAFGADGANNHWFTSNSGTTEPGNLGYGFKHSAGSVTEHYFLTSGSQRVIIDSTGRVGINTGTPAARLHVIGEVRTTDGSGNGRVWGEGRPNAVRYGTTGAESGLCTNGGVSFGLSRGIGTWNDAASVCPLGTWVCTAAERGGASCDTARPDGGTDGLSCSVSALNWSSNNHIGWVADLGSEVTGHYIEEDGSSHTNYYPCNSYPVWCCSE